MSQRLERGTISLVLRHPSSVPGALRAGMAIAPKGWWRRAPFLPLPDREYWQFRLETANGGDGLDPPSPHEVLAVARWFPRMRRMRR